MILDFFKDANCKLCRRFKTTFRCKYETEDGMHELDNKRIYRLAFCCICIAELELNYNEKYSIY
jgi:hypothetical protein